MLRDEIFPEDSWDESFEDYREMMEENFSYISKYKVEFIKDKSICTRSKLERITEVLDFYMLEEEYEKCEVLKKIKDALDVRIFFTD